MEGDKKYLWKLQCGHIRTSYPPDGLPLGNAPSLKKHVPVPADPAETSVTSPFPDEQPPGW